jgi:hypothetical protein
MAQMPLNAIPDLGPDIRPERPQVLDSLRRELDLIAHSGYIIAMFGQESKRRAADDPPNGRELSGVASQPHRS